MVSSFTENIWAFLFIQTIKGIENEKCVVHVTFVWKTCSNFVVWLTGCSSSVFPSEMPVPVTFACLCYLQQCLLCREQAFVQPLQPKWPLYWYEIFVCLIIHSFDFSNSTSYWHLLWIRVLLSMFGLFFRQSIGKNQQENSSQKVVNQKLFLLQMDAISAWWRFATKICHLFKLQGQSSSWFVLL